MGSTPELTLVPVIIGWTKVELSAVVVGDDPGEHGVLEHWGVISEFKGF